MGYADSSLALGMTEAERRVLLAVIIFAKGLGWCPAALFNDLEDVSVADNADRLMAFADSKAANVFVNHDLATVA